MNLAPRPKGNEEPDDPFIPDFSEGLETGLYLALFELLDEGLIITGDEVVLEANSAACRLLERDYRQIAGKPLAELFPSERAFLDARARLFIQGETRGSLQVSLPGERRRDLRFVAAARIRPGIHVLILSPDLIAEAYAEASNADAVWPRLAAALEQPVIVVDDMGLVAAANAPAVHALGMARASIVGRPLDASMRVEWPMPGETPVARLHAGKSAAPLVARVLAGPRPDWHLLVLRSSVDGARPLSAPATARSGGEDMFARVFAESPLPTLLAEGPELRIVAANVAAARTYGFDAAALRMMRMAELSADGDMPDWQEPGVRRHRHRDGEVFEVELLAYPLDLPGRPDVVVFMHDLPNAPMLASRLRLPLEAFEASAQAVLVTDVDNRILAANQAFLGSTGYALSDVKGQPLSMLDAERQEPGLHDDIARALQDKGRWEGETWTRAKNGEIRPEWLAITVLRGRGERTLHHVAMFADLLAKRQAESRAHYLAHHDTLTGLPNRRLFETRFNEALERARPLRRGVALLRVDLDQFKSINREYGHDTGDTVLQHLARRLLTALPAEACIARERSDAFLAMLPDIDRSGEVERAARSLLSALATPFQMDGRELRVSASIGIALYPDDGNTLECLIPRATAALQRARGCGGGNAQCYSDELDAASTEAPLLQNDVRRAVERNELLLQFQPLVDARDARVRGGEALLRWNHAGSGLLPYSRFAELARQAGLLNRLGDWVLHAACAEAVGWPDINGRPARLTVNVAIEQILDDDLPIRVRDALAASGLPAARLELDLDEAILKDDSVRIVGTLHALRELGVHVAVDDFGRGLASIPRLKRYPLSALKLDPALVREVGVREESEAIVEAIASMANVLGLDVFARGVEGPAQQAFLSALGCHLQQGPLFGKPMSPASFRAFLAGPAQ